MLFLRVPLVFIFYTSKIKDAGWMTCVSKLVVKKAKSVAADAGQRLNLYVKPIVKLIETLIFIFIKEEVFFSRVIRPDLFNVFIGLAVIL